MAHKNISKKINSQNDFYETIVDIYNVGGCESVREYIDNNDIDSTEYNNALEEMLDDDNTDELFELMITHEKFKHTIVIDNFIFFDGRNFKLDLAWKIKELDFYEKKMKLNFYKMELKKTQEEIRQELSNELILSPLELSPLELPQLDLSELKPPKLDLSPLELSPLELPQLDLSEFNKLYRSKIFRREKELELEIFFIERELKEYFDVALHVGNINALTKVIDYEPTLFKKADFLVFFANFAHNTTDKYDILNYILNNKNKVVTENLIIPFVESFIEKELLSTNMTEEIFKKILNIMSKNVSEEQFQFLLAYLMRMLVCAYSNTMGNILKLEEIAHKYDFNIIELAKYIHKLYGHKFKIRFNFNIDDILYYYRNNYDEKNIMYDQMIFNGEDLFFPKKDLINHINDKNNLFKRKIKDGDLNKKDMLLYIEYKKILSEFVSNIHTIMKEIDSKQLKCLQDLITDIDTICDEMMDKYIHRLI